MFLETTKFRMNIRRFGQAVKRRKNQSVRYVASLQYSGGFLLEPFRNKDFGHKSDFNFSPDHVKIAVRSIGDSSVSPVFSGFLGFSCPAFALIFDIIRTHVLS